MISHGGIEQIAAPTAQAYGLDPLTITAIKARAAKLDRLEGRMGCLVFPLSYLAIVCAAWPFVGPDALFLVFPALIIGMLLHLAAKRHLDRYIERRKQQRIQGYTALERFERATAEHERHVKEVTRRAEQENRRREQEIRRQTWQYWSSILPSEFEFEVAKLFRQHGYTAQVCGGAGDQGVDIILTKGHRRICVQCKRYRQKVGPGPVRELYGAMQLRRVTRGILVCPAGFTEGAYKTARRCRITLIGLKRLVALGDGSWSL